MQQRTRERLEAEVQRELADILEHEVKDPVMREAFATVAEVRLSPDGRHARVYLFVPGDEAQQDKSMAAFHRNQGFLRTALAARLEVRHVPDLDFQLDETLDKALRIDELLDKVKDEDNTHPP
ncbi:MAG: 30S ribosome-binding factor RbfA [Candidatus Bipolaricaulota bacterium]